MKEANFPKRALLTTLMPSLAVFRHRSMVCASAIFSSPTEISVLIFSAQRFRWQQKASHGFSRRFIGRSRQRWSRVLQTGNTNGSGHIFVWRFAIMQISEHWLNQWVLYLCYHGDMDVCRPNENITCKDGHSAQCHCQPTWYHGQHFSATLHFRNASVILYVFSVIIYSVICHHIRCHSHHAMMPLLSYTVSLLSYTVLMSPTLCQSYSTQRHSHLSQSWCQPTRCNSYPTWRQYKPTCMVSLSS